MSDSIKPLRPNLPAQPRRTGGTEPGAGPSQLGKRGEVGDLPAAESSAPPARPLSEDSFGGSAGTVERAASDKKSRRLEDRTSTPRLRFDQLDVVQRFEFPPGHIEVTPSGRLFVDPYFYGPKFKPGGQPESIEPQSGLVIGGHQERLNLHTTELIPKKQGGGFDLVPFPREELQKQFNKVHQTRYDPTRNCLWVIDFGGFDLAGLLQDRPKIVAFDLATGEQIHKHVFDKSVVEKGSMLNDLQVGQDGNLYLSNSSPIAKDPSIIMYNPETGTPRRILKDHKSVSPASYDIHVQGKPFSVLMGLIKPKYGIDGIVVGPGRDDPKTEWLYWAPFNSGELYGLPVSSLQGSEEQIERSVQKVADITMTDGMAVRRRTADGKTELYLTDVEHGAIVRLEPGGELTTIVKDERLRWPSNISFGPDGSLYFTCNAIDQVQMKSADTIRKGGPYELFRIPAELLKS